MHVLYVLLGQTLLVQFTELVKGRRSNKVIPGGEA